MIEGQVYYEGQLNGKPGVEYSYMLKDKTLYIKIPGVNHHADFFRCFFFKPVPLKANFLASAKVHSYWKEEAVRIYILIATQARETTVNRIEIVGSSMGGPIASIVGFFFHYWERGQREIDVKIFNAPKAGDKIFMKTLDTIEHMHYYNVGDIIHMFPLRWPKYANVTKRKPWRNFVKAHVHDFPEWNNFPI